MNYIFIDSNEEADRIGLVEQDELVEIYIDEKNKLNLGQIYRGRVQSVVKGLNSAFIDIGQGKNAYLSFKDLPAGDIKESGLVENQCLLVQVEKEGQGDKGPKVSAKIEILGRNMVLVPYGDQIRISRKIKDRKEYGRLLAIAQELNTRGQGLIFRTSIEGLSQEEISREYEELVASFDKIQREKNFLPCPKLIHTDILDWQRIMLAKLDELDRVIVNTREKYQELTDLLKDQNRPTDKLFLDLDYSLDYDEKVHPFIARGLKRSLSLNSGASIVIDELEALTAIDINTQAVKKDRSFRKNILKVNMDSAKKIAQEIRLRNISGIILIDFINMDREQDRELVRKTLVEELSQASIKSYVYGYTSLGLLEMSRTKKRNSLKDTWKPSR